MKILAINPGSTSTKIAVYHDLKPVLLQSINHTLDELAPFANAMEQFDYRRDLVLKELEHNKIPIDFDAVIGRAGLLKPIEGGVYAINELMHQETYNAKRKHACNLGCLIAYDIAQRIPGCPALIADPGVTDELDDIARISGSPLLPRITTWHALNQRAIARRYASQRGTAYEKLRLIIVHMGGGISIGSHVKGRCIDVNNALDGEGPFSPERAGSLPARQLVELAVSGHYGIEDLIKRIAGQAGLSAHLGTTDAREIERRIEEGDRHAQLVYDAMIYNIAKYVGAAATVLKGQVDAILLTGGLARSEYIIPRLIERIAFIAPVHVFPGEDELQALAENAELALAGKLPIKEYV